MISQSIGAATAAPAAPVAAPMQQNK